MFALSASLFVATTVISNAAGALKDHVCAVGSTCVSYALTAGVSDPNEPSGMAPPLANAMPGYDQTYVTDFTGAALPTGWSTFSGVPGGDAGTQFAPSQVSVANGEMKLTASFSSSANEWLTGGTCLCSVAQEYGAYFVRSRMTGPGPTVAELLWPQGNSSWPPEVDFNETYGGTSGSMATVHFGANNLVDHRRLAIDMTQWHTWGVVWTPTSLTYVVDGDVWGVITIPNEIPRDPMTLDIQQQTWCSRGFACPDGSESTLVDWAAQFTPQSKPASSTPPVKRATTRISIDASLSAPRLDAVVREAASTIFRRHAHVITLKATVATRPDDARISPAARVQQILGMLEQDLRNLGTSPPQFLVRWSRVASRSPPRLKLLLTVAA